MARMSTQWKCHSADIARGRMTLEKMSDFCILSWKDGIKGNNGIPEDTHSIIPSPCLPKFSIIPTKYRKDCPMV